MKVFRDLSEGWLVDGSQTEGLCIGPAIDDHAGQGHCFALLEVLGFLEWELLINKIEEGLKFRQRIVNGLIDSIHDVRL